jgi:hypothetical protein
MTFGSHFFARINPDRRATHGRRHLLGAVVASLVVLGACGGDGDDPAVESAGNMTSEQENSMSAMDGGMNAEAPRVPPVFGYHDDEEIFFIHTEASDPATARVLEGMMQSPVPVVASLADVPHDALGTVFLFTNGIKPSDTPLGPMNFQPDVFDSAPGDDDYTPLRRVAEVTWNDEADAELLTSADDIAAAEADGKITVEATDVVINAPLLTWPGGQR